MMAKVVIARCAREGIALFLRDDGSVGFRSAHTIPADLLASARLFRSDPTMYRLENAVVNSEMILPLSISPRPRSVRRGDP
jgi:hypothetical protein